MTIDEVEQAIKLLPPADRAKLLARKLTADEIIAVIGSLTTKERIYVLETGIGNCPPEERTTVLENLRTAAAVYIYDQEGVNLSSPCAMVIYNDRCEHINIISSVRKNADSIRHPAISLAIRRWSNTIARQFALARNKGRAAGASWELTKGNFFKKAQGHIKNIGRALRDASQSQQKMEAAIAFAPIIQVIYENVAPYLQVCWNALKLNKNEIRIGINDEGDRYDRDDWEKCRVLKEKALEYFRIHSFGDWASDPPVDDHVVKTLEPAFDIVLKFFDNPQGSVFFSKPNKFDVILSAYAQWATGLSADAVSNYRGRIERARRPKVDDLRFLMPEISETVGRSYNPVSGKVVSVITTQGENYYHTSELDDCFNLPTVPCTMPQCQHHQHPRYKK